MMHSSSCCLLALVTATLPLAAQRVVPAPNAAQFGGWREGAFGESTPRVQQIIDGSEFCTSTAQITGLAFRRGPGKYGSTPQAGQLLRSLRVRVGYAAVRPEQMGLNYASNIVPNSMTTVINGIFNMPNLYPSQGASVWQVQWPLSQPFNYVQAVGGLLIDMEHSDVYPAYRYELDAVDVTSGSARMLPGGTCGRLPGTNACLPSVLNRTESYPQIGGRLVAEMFNLPSAVPAFTVLGLSSSRWGSVNLPLDLTAMGAAPGNSLQVSMDFVLPMTTFRAPASYPWAGRYAASLSLPIPNQPMLVGAEFFAQSYAAIGAPALPVTTGFGWAVKVGEARAPMQMIFGLSGSANAMGLFGGGRSSSGPAQRHGGLVTRLSGTFQ